MVENERMNIKLSEFQYDDESQLFRLPEQIRHLEEKYTYSDGKIENYILSAIKNATDISDDSEELMKLSKDWPSYYHLGIGRSNIIKCLDLNKQIKVLELGSGCGAITRCLGERFESVDCVEGSLLRAKITRERCRDLNNVRVFCSDIKMVEFEPKYDVVTLIGVLEYAPVYFPNNNNKNPFHTFLEIAKTALKPDGVLIIAIENKIGLKYWGGCPEDHTGKIYDGIHGYPVNGTPQTFSKSEIKNLLDNIGFAEKDFYYCFPDYKFMTEVLSEKGDERLLYLYNWISIPFDLYNLSKKSTFHEGLALKTISDAGLLWEFANSFLVVAGNNSDIVNKPDWAAKRFSLNRLKEYRCITTLKLKPKTYIEKIGFQGNSKKNVGVIQIEDSTFNISHVVQDSQWHKGDLLIFEIYRAAYKEDFRNDILNILKTYYYNLLLKRFHKGYDENGYPLLQGCAIDLIFRNVIIGENKELLPIDAEWQVENDIPADYVMYRCIKRDVADLIDEKSYNFDKFTINLLSAIFPNYNKQRHDRNKKIENQWGCLIYDDINIGIFIKNGLMSSIISNNITRKVINQIWLILPNNLKNLIKKHI